MNQDKLAIPYHSPHHHIRILKGQSMLLSLTDVAAATSFIYSSWETNKVIMEELLRNLCLAMVAVFIMTLILLANVVAAIFVLISVTLTLVSCVQC